MLAAASFALYIGTKAYQYSGASETISKPQEFALLQKIQDGDIIFQISLSNQSQAIQLATKSKYSHMGILYKDNGKFFVFEAVRRVQLTPLQKWITRGKNGYYVVKRLKNADTVLTPSALKKMRQSGKQFQGKPYDIYFEWSNDKMYCSELVWKIYKKGANIEIGKLERLTDFDLSNAIVRNKLKERYGVNLSHKMLTNEKIISPAAMFRSNKLVTIAENN